MMQRYAAIFILRRRGKIMNHFEEKPRKCVDRAVILPTDSGVNPIVCTVSGSGLECQSNEFLG
jgi:hypothetical protein